MYLTDYHVHSLCSPDGQDPMSTLAGAAAALGVNELCFTDHCDLLDYGGVHVTEFDWAPVRAQFAEAQAHYGGTLTLRLGLELGGAVYEPEAADRILAAPDLDFVIGSIHNCGGKDDFYFLRYTSPEQCYEKIELYLDEMLSLARLGKFDVLGHITYPLRYMNERDGMNVDFLRYEDRLREIFRTVVRQEKGIELNTNRGNTPLPPPEILKLYRECGGEYITLGSDAHSAQHIAAGMKQGRELLEEAGFRYLTLYQKRRPSMIRL